MGSVDTGQLRKQYTELLDQAEEILNGAMNEKRAMTATEQTQFDDLRVRVDQIGCILQDREATPAEETEPQPRHPSTWGKAAQHRDGPPAGFEQRYAREMRENSGAILPAEVRMVDLPPSEDWNKWRSRMSDVSDADLRELSLAKLIRSAMGGEVRENDLELRVLATTPGSAGGFVIPEPLSDLIIDLARSQSVAFRLGATQVTMDATTLAVGKLASDPVGEWLAENAAATESGVTFGQDVLRAKKFATLLRWSEEWGSDTVGGDQAVLNAMSQVIALGLDAAILAGSGVGEEPLGILNTVGVGSVTMTDDWPSVVELETDLSTANELTGRLGYALDAATVGLFKVTEKVTSTGIFIMGEGLTPLNGYGVGVSNQLPVAVDDHSGIFGAWDKSIVGMRRGISVEVSNSAVVGGESTFERFQRAVRVWLRADVVLPRPSAFSTFTDLTIP